MHAGVNLSGVRGRRLLPDRPADRGADGYDYHQDRHNFESDREREAHHLAEGIATYRLTSGRYLADPGHEARRLHHIIEERTGR
jgi:hypothetical protein